MKEMISVPRSSNFPYLPKSYPFPLEKAPALLGYLTLVLGADVSQKPVTGYEVMRLRVKRHGESVYLNLHHKEISDALGRLTPQGKETALLLETHSALQAMKLNPVS